LVMVCARKGVHQPAGDIKTTEAVMKWILAIFLSMVVFSAIYGMSIDPDFWQHVNESRIEQEAVQAALPTDYTGLYVIGVIVFLIALWIMISEIASSKVGIPVLVILGGLALIIAATGLYMYSDKNGDGSADAQIVMVVQPAGDNAKSDMQYAEVNQANSKANVFNVSAVSIFIIVLVAAIFFLGFVGVVVNGVAESRL